MHELMLMMGGRGRLYPDSGPGPKYAIGNDDLGFFGEVTSKELFTTAELRTQLDLTIGSTLVEAPTWLKFYHRGRVLYIPLTNIIGSVSWAMLYQSGLVYGVNGHGPLGEMLDLIQTDQLRLVEKDEFVFRVRLIRDDVNVDHSGPTGYDSDPLRESEFNALLYRVSKRFKDSQDKPFPSWGNYTDAQLDLGKMILVRETYNPEKSSVWFRSSPSHPLHRSAVSNTSLQYWRPVLELDLGEELYSQIRHSYQSDSNMTAVGAILPKTVFEDIVPIASATPSFTETALLSQIRHSGTLEGDLMDVGGIKYISGQGLVAMTVSSVQASMEPQVGLFAPSRLGQKPIQDFPIGNIQTRMVDEGLSPIASVSINFLE